MFKKYEILILCQFFSCQSAKEDEWARNVTFSRRVISCPDSWEGYIQTELPEWTSVHLAIPAKQVASLPSISYSGYQVFTYSKKLLKQSTYYVFMYSYTRFCVHKIMVSLWWINFATDQILHCKYLQFFIVSSFHCSFVVRFTFNTISSPR